MKRNTVLVMVFIGTLATFVFLNTRKFLASGYSYSIEYCKKNASNIENLKTFVLSNDLLNDSITSSYIQFFIRRKENVFIVRNTLNGRFETTQPSPSYIEDFFLGNKLRNISIKKDGLIFENIFFIWGSKAGSLKYFFYPPKLIEHSLYQGKYLVTHKQRLNKNGETCFVIDENWILLIERDN